MQVLYYLIGGILVASALSSEYLQPKKPWPGWAAATVVVIVLLVLLYAISLRDRKTPRQIIEEYESLKSELRRITELKSKAEKEHWTADAKDRLHRDESTVRRRIATLRS